MDIERQLHFSATEVSRRHAIHNRKEKTIITTLICSVRS
jgi:hypothetical protein